MKVLITGGGSGGHVSPALALAEKLRQAQPDIGLLYVGGDLTMEGATGDSLEATLVKPTGIPLKVIRAGKLKRGGLSWTTLTRLWGVVPGMWQAWRVVREFGPTVVFSSGGYVSLPVVIAAWLQRIPVVIHEQTAAVGLANSVAGKLASRIAITFPSSAQYFNASKVVVTGNPISTKVLQPDMSLLQSSGFGQWLRQSHQPILYITGGGLGSHVLNVAIEERLEQLLSKYRVVHQCGSHAGFADYDRLANKAKQFSVAVQKNYWLAQHLTIEEVGLLYSQAALVVARAGANTVLELAAWGLPAIFVPIPWVTHDEQTKNAQALVEVGTAVILPEKELTGERLEQEVLAMLNRVSGMTAARQKAKQLVDGRAVDRLYDVVMQSAKGI